MSEDLIFFSAMAICLSGCYGVFVFFVKYGIDPEKFSYLMKLRDENIYAYFMALTIITILIMLFATPAYYLITLTGIIGKAIEHLLKMTYHFLRHLANTEKKS